LFDLMSQCILVEPGTLRDSLSLIGSINPDTAPAKLQDILSLLIEIHAPLGHGSEVAWALWASVFYNIPISDKASLHLKNFDDSIIALIALHGVEKGLIIEDVKEYWQKYMTSSSLKDGHWLLAYEADLKGWLPSLDASNHIDSDRHFKILKQNNISFYDKDITYLVSDAEMDDGYESASDDDSSPDNTTDLPWPDFLKGTDDLPF
jgi:hypothetical protein